MSVVSTSTETVGLLGTGAQDGHLDFHTAPELCCFRTSPRPKLKSEDHTASAGRKRLPAGFGKSGHVGTIPLEDRRTVSESLRTQRHVQNCLSPECLRSLGPAGHRRGLFLRYDIASAHTQRLAFSVRVRCSCCRTLGPYSPDLSPRRHFLLFPERAEETRERYRHTLFESAEDAPQTLTSRAAEAISKSAWLV